MGLTATSERITTGITCLLGLVTSFTDVRSRLPPSSQINSMDIWMVACILFVTFQMIECTVVTFLYDKRYKVWLKRVEHPEIEIKKRRLERSVSSTARLTTGQRRSNRLNAIKGQYGDTGHLDGKRRNRKKRGYFSRLWNHLFRIKKITQDDLEDPAYLPLQIDNKSRFLFPLAFLIFCIYYWISLFSTD